MPLRPYEEHPEQELNDARPISCSFEDGTIVRVTLLQPLLSLNKLSREGFYQNKGLNIYMLAHIYLQQSLLGNLQHIFPLFFE